MAASASYNPMGLIVGLLRLVWQLVRGVCLALGAMLLLFILLIVWAAGSMDVSVAPHKAVAMPAAAVLVVPLESDFDTAGPAGFYDSLMGTSLSLTTLMETLDEAAVDEAVKSVVVTIKGADLGFAQAQEIRPAIKRLRAAGKKTAIYASSYDSLPTYYLAAAFDVVWLQPVGTVALEGFGGQMPFFKGLMDKIGIGPNFIQRKEYKSAMENVARSGLSDPARSMLDQVFGSISDQVVRDVAQDRRVTTDKIWSALNQAILTGDEAREAGLVDRIGHGDELERAIKADYAPKDGVAPDDLFIGLEDYRVARGMDPSVKPWPLVAPKSDINSDKKDVAVITVNGPIFAHAGAGALELDRSLSAEEIAEAIDEAVKDDSIKALLVRVDSPGGSAVASEMIRHALVRAKESDKPIVVAMGGVAASGGYWIASAADHILAQGTTLTGSIGVVGGKFDVDRLSKKLGVTWDGISLGQNANMFSLAQGFSFSESERMNKMLDDVYAQFVAVVAQGRGLKPEQVEEIAKGRVWTGAQAKENGLVDEIGGLREAKSFIANLVGTASPRDLRLVDYPPPMTPIEELMSLLDGQARVGQVVATAGKVLTLVEGNKPKGVYAVDPMLEILH